MEQRKVLASTEDDGFLRKDLRQVYSRPEFHGQEQQDLLAIENHMEEGRQLQQLRQEQQQRQLQDSSGVFVGWAGKHTEYATNIVMVQVSKNE